MCVTAQEYGFHPYELAARSSKDVACHVLLIARLTTHITGREYESCTTGIVRAMSYVSRFTGYWFGSFTGRQYFESSGYLAPLYDFFMAAEPEIRGLSTVTMQVIVELHSGRLITIEPSIDGTVDDAMQMTEDKTGIPAHLLLLNFEGKQLESGRRLSEYDIRRESTIRQGFALLGGGGKTRGG